MPGESPCSYIRRPSSFSPMITRWISKLKTVETPSSCIIGSHSMMLPPELNPLLLLAADLLRPQSINVYISVDTNSFYEREIQRLEPMARNDLGLEESSFLAFLGSYFHRRKLENLLTEQVVTHTQIYLGAQHIEDHRTQWPQDLPRTGLPIPQTLSTNFFSRK